MYLRRLPVDQNVIPSHLVPELLAALERRPLLKTDTRHPLNLKHDVQWERPMPSHAALDVEQLERVLCLEVGHREALVQLEPVLGPFTMCTRCGKWHR